MIKHWSKWLISIPSKIKLIFIKTVVFTSTCINTPRNWSTNLSIWFPSKSIYFGGSKSFVFPYSCFERNFQVSCDSTCSTRPSSSPLKWIGLNCSFFLACFGVNLNDIYLRVCVTSPVNNWLPQWWVIGPPYPLL